MKEKPILFSGAMVRAILSGAKSQTRRVMKNQPIVAYRMGRIEQFCSTGYPQDSRGYTREQLAAFCPYGKPGDRLWCRETFARLDDLRTKDPGVYALQSRAFFRADHPTGLYHDDGKDLTWRPSIFMPRELSRINLEITNIRVERLQEISEADAIAEGMQKSERTGMYPSPQGNCDYATWAFHYGWDSLNAKRGFGWDSNCWVWVIEFKRVQPETTEGEN